MILYIGVGESVASCAGRQEEFDLTFPVLSDLNSEIYGVFAGGEIPHLALIDYNQVMTFSQSGFDEETVTNLVNDALVEMVKIDHSPLNDTENITLTRPIEITLESGPNLIDNNPVMHWRLSGWDSFESKSMASNTSGGYVTEVSPFPPDSVVEYYISGENINGHHRYFPPDGPMNPIRYRIGRDRESPLISYTEISQWSINRVPASLSIFVQDNSGVGTVEVEFQVNGIDAGMHPAYKKGPGQYRYIFDVPVISGDVVSYRIIARDTSTSRNTSISPTDGFNQFTVVDPVTVLIYDLDPNHNSGPVIASTCNSLEIENEYRTDLPEHLMKYQSIFLCLGMDQSSHRLTQGEGKWLAKYLENGGRLYMEGGNTWFADVPVTLHDYFPITGISDGDAIAGPLTGITGSFAEGLNMPYSGEGQFVDRINVTPGGFEFLENTAPDFPVGAGYIGDSYRTIGMTVEFGGIDDGSPDRPLFLEALVDFLATPPPSATPIPSLTPTPVPTSTPILETATRLHMPRNHYSSGDPFWVTAELTHIGNTLSDIRLFILLEVFGVYYFGPAWQAYPPAIDWWTIRTLESGSTYLDAIPVFLWPENTGTIENLTFTGAITDEDITTIYGSISTRTFGFTGN